MKRIATALLIAAALQALPGGSTSFAQDATPSATTEAILTQVAAAQREEDALQAALATSIATDQAARDARAAATVTALEQQVASAEATNTALTSEVAALQTQVAALEAGVTRLPAGTIEVNQGEVAAAGAWDITVTGVRTGDAIESRVADEKPAAARGVFLLVELTIVNAGTEAQTYDPTWFAISDDRGRTWSFDFTQTDNLALAGAGLRQYASVAPGLTNTAIVVFDIAPDATGLSLRTQPAAEMEHTGGPQPAPFLIHLAPTE